jgi:hypothetical protein
MVLRTRMSQKPSQRRGRDRAVVRTGNDGIHQMRETIRSLDGTRPAREELTQIRQAQALAASTFDFELARYLRHLPTVDPAADEPMWPDLRWYSAQVQRLLARLRTQLAKDPVTERGLIYAFRVGTLVTDAQWRIGHGDQVRRSIQRVAQTRVAGKAPKARRADPERDALWSRIVRLRRQGLSDPAIRKTLVRSHAHEDAPVRDAYRQRVNRLLKKLDA